MSSTSLKSHIPPFPMNFPFWPLLYLLYECVVNTVFTAGAVPHYLTFDFSLSTLFTPSFNSRCFRRQPCRLWVDSANPWAGKQEGRIPCWRSELKVFLSCKCFYNIKAINSTTMVIYEQSKQSWSKRILRSINLPPDEQVCLF